MSRIDDVARGLALRSTADLPFERIARAAATPMSRRRTLGVLGGAMVAAAVPTSWVTPRRAWGSYAGCTDCGVEHGAGCVGNLKCGQGVLIDEPVCCPFPGYFEPFDTQYGSCAQAGGHGETPPGGAVCCCPTGFTCGNPAVEACVCPRPCGDKCCKPDEECVEPPGADVDEDLICGPPCEEGVRCFSAAGTHCCDDTDCCGDGCCPDGEGCCGDENDPDTQFCCPQLDGYVCSGEAFVCGCSDSQQCGPHCCPKGSTCYRGVARSRGEERSYQCTGPGENFFHGLFRHFFGTFSRAAVAGGASAGPSKRLVATAAAADGSEEALVALGAVANLAALTLDRFRTIRPDSAYRRPAKVRAPRLVPVGPGLGLDPSAAQALDKLLSTEARAWAFMNAAATAYARSLGALRAGDIRAARRQARAFGRFAGQAAKPMRRVPALRTAVVTAMQAGGTPEMSVTAAEMRAYQDSLRSGGLPADMRARLVQLGLGRADQRRVTKIILARNPESGPVLIAPLADSRGLAEARNLARLLGRTAARTRVRPISIRKGGARRVRGSRPQASQSSQRGRRGSA